MAKLGFLQARRMPKPNSPFYPPRAPWYAPAREAGHAALAVTGVHRIPTPAGIGVGRFLAGLVLPGYAFAIHGRRRIGRELLVLWLALFVLGIVFLGLPSASLFFGLAISVHATSVIHLMGPWLRQTTLGHRFAGGAAAVAGLILFVYLPLQALTSHFFFTPIHHLEDTVVLRPTRNPAGIRRGDWIAYQMDFTRLGAMVFQGGMSLGPVMGFPGETVQFHPGYLVINGKTYPREPSMPTHGDVAVPESTWFVWPRLRNVRTIGVDAETIQASIVSQSIVPQSQIRGRPFARWFHRQQLLATP